MKNIVKDDCINFEESIYGLVQAVRQYHKYAVQFLEQGGFSKGNFCPCLYMKKNEKRVVYITWYVDDKLLTNDPEAIEDSVENNLHDYLPCNFKFSDDKRKAWLG